MSIIKENRALILGFGFGLAILAAIVSITLYLDTSKLDTVMAILGVTVLLPKFLWWLWDPKWPDE